jgi:hypothetical protein
MKLALHEDSSVVLSLSINSNDFKIIHQYAMNVIGRVISVVFPQLKYVGYLGSRKVVRLHMRCSFGL